MTVREVATEEEEQEQEEKESAECKPKNKNRTEWSGETAKSPVKSKPTSEILCFLSMCVSLLCKKHSCAHVRGIKHQGRMRCPLETYICLICKGNRLDVLGNLSPTEPVTW